MLSEKVIEYLKEEGYFDDTRDESYEEALVGIGTGMEDEIAEFNLNTNAITFDGQVNDLYNICWFIINSTYGDQIGQMQRALKLPEVYIPLDSFEGGGGCFYNRDNKEVLELEAGEKLIAFQQGELNPQWKSFNDFLEWYFELD